MTIENAIRFFESRSESATMPAAREAFALALTALQGKLEREAPAPTGIWYSPMAVTQDGEKLFTYDSVFTVEKALRQFSIWEDSYDYKIKEAWIECSDGKRIEVVRKWAEVTENAS